MYNNEHSCAVIQILAAQRQLGLSGFLSVAKHHAITLPTEYSRLPKHFGLDHGCCWLVNFIIFEKMKINSISETPATVGGK